MTDKDNTTVMISKKWASRLIAIATRNQRSNSGQLRHWIMTEDGLGVMKRMSAVIREMIKIDLLSYFFFH